MKTTNTNYCAKMKTHYFLFAKHMIYARYSQQMHAYNNHVHVLGIDIILWIKLVGCSYLHIHIVMRILSMYILSRPCEKCIGTRILNKMKLTMYCCVFFIVFRTMTNNLLGNPSKMNKFTCILESFTK